MRTVLTNYDICDIIRESKLINYYLQGRVSMDKQLEVMHINEIYSCVEVSTPSELYYIAELNKYLESYGRVLSIEGVAIKEEYKSCIYYSYLKSTDVIGVEHESLPEDLRGKLFTKFLDLDDIYIEKESNIEWVFDFDGKGRNTKNYTTFKGLLASQAYVSFMALLTINKIMKGQPSIVKFDFTVANVCITKNYTTWDIIDLWLIYLRTRALSSWVSFELPKEKLAEAQLNYEAYVIECRLVQNVTDYMPVSEKIEYYRSHFMIGDIVMLYTKLASGSERDSIKQVESCQIARIDKATNEGITLMVFNAKDTPLTAKKRIESLPARVRELYGNNHYMKHNEQSTFVRWSDIGLEVGLYMEQQFFTDLNCNDSACLWFEKNGEEFELELDNADAIYAILCERNIEFNKERFKKLYFSKKPSIYISRVVEG